MKSIIGCSLVLFLALTIVPVYADDYQEGLDAFKRNDYETAFKKLKPFAKQGDAIAQFHLGEMYYTGQGVAWNNKEAAKWSRRSADQGNGKAQSFLASMYWFGHGVPKDNVSAYMWNSLAASSGDNSLSIVVSSLRNIFAKKMTLDQIAEAQKLAREWMEKHK